MTEEQADTIAALWVLIHNQWPTFEVLEETEPTYRVRLRDWCDVIGDLHYSLLRAAVIAEAGREFPPPVGIIRRRAMEIMLESRGDRSPSADEAWREVVTKLRQVGRQEFPEWSHPAVEAAVRTIGWIWICDSENMDVLRSHFLRFYGAISERFDHGADPLPPGVAAVLPEPFNRLGLGSGADGGA